MLPVRLPLRSAGPPHRIVLEEIQSSSTIHRGPCGGGQVLDLAGGSAPLHPRLPGRECTGVDPSAAELALARRHVAGRLGGVRVGERAAVGTARNRAAWAVLAGAGSVIRVRATRRRARRTALAHGVVRRWLREHFGVVGRERNGAVEVDVHAAHDGEQPRARPTRRRPTLRQRTPLTGPTRCRPRCAVPVTPVAAGLPACGPRCDMPIPPHRSRATGDSSTRERLRALPKGRSRARRGQMRPRGCPPAPTTGT